jgi:thiol:disulfide interchange protein DsbD
MGTTAGLVVSPCVGPVVGAILLEIAGQTAGVGSTAVASSTSGLLRGIVLMTSFGIGLGIPFLLIGILSHWAPQSGPWLMRVKYILGLPILYFAYTYYLKAMETAGVPENVAHAMLVGIVSIGMAVLIGAFHQLGENPQPSLLLRRALGIILLIIGIHFLYNGLGHSGILLMASRPNPAPPASTVTNNPIQTPAEVIGNLEWQRDFPMAQARARREQKPLFVDFYATWCANCKAFTRLTQADIRLNAALQQAILAKIYDTDPIFRSFQQDANFPELGGVGGQPFLPLFAIYAPAGSFVWKGQNYTAVQTMIAQLERAKHAGIQ